MKKMHIIMQYSQITLMNPIGINSIKQLNGIKQCSLKTAKRRDCIFLMSIMLIDQWRKNG